jgi:hypothetical protein
MALVQTRATGYNVLPAHAREVGLLVFAGAGISMIPPSSLPNWYQFNEAVLEALAAEVGAYTRPAFREWIFEGLVARRNQTPAFAPDYMADIIAEEIGMDYLHVVQALDSDEVNTCHLALAALMRAGIVRAIVTTNFDRLIERACDRLGVSYRVYATADAYEQLATAPEAGEERPTPIIKVHGTVENIDSMVDSMSQRLVMRPEALASALAHLYARHYILFLGFSGADLDYDPNYLGLRAAAERNQGFTYLSRPGSAARASIRALQESWGATAALAEGALPDALLALAGAYGVAVEPVALDASPIPRLEVVRQHAADWAARLGRLQTVNILSSLLRASGDDTTAGRLFWSIWKHYRQPGDLDTPVYGRFNHLIGRYLLEYGFTIDSIRPPYSVGFTVGDAPFDKDKLDNAFQYLARAAHMGVGQAYPDLAACFALMGRTRQALDFTEQMLSSAIEHEHRVAYVDAALVGGLVWSLAGVWSGGLPYLEFARQFAIQVGQEPRRARLCAHLVRFLAWQQRWEAAEEHYAEGVRIADRLGMEATYWELICARGCALTNQQRPAEALASLSAACEFYERTGRMPLLTRAALDLFSAATWAGAEGEFTAAQEYLTEHEAGYAPLVYALRVEAGLAMDDLPYARQELAHLLTASTECENDWGLLAASEFERVIAERERAETTA